MTDLTPLFQQCVDIVQQELVGSLKKPVAPPIAPYLVKDTFVKECNDVYDNLVKLATFIAEIRPLYLQMTDELSSFALIAHKELSVEDKNRIDEEFKFNVQKVYEKLKQLQAYETKRTDLAESRKKKKGLVLSLFSTDEHDPEMLYVTVVSSHRTQILRFLNETTKSVNLKFEKMQQKRSKREKQLNLLHFQNLDDDDLDATAFYRSEYQLDILQYEQEQDSFKADESELSQQQIQELELENKELLTLKTNEFKQVEKLHHSIVDIVKLQTELTMHLETQAEQIENLMEGQDQIEADLRMGNKNLSKATDRNKRGSKIIITTCIVLGFFILFVDYIS